MIMKKSETVNRLNIINCRDYFKHNIDKFIRELGKCNWNEVLNTNELEKSYELFYEMFHNMYENCFPSRQVQIKYKNRKTWLTEGMKNSIKEKNRLFILQKNKPYLHNQVMYKTYGNKLNTLLAKAERQHYFELFDINRNNLVKTWSMIKELINKKKSDNIQTSFMINNKYVDDKRKICESFNDFS